MDENSRIVNQDSYNNNVLNPFKLNLYFLRHNYHHNYFEEKFRIINLRHFIFSILDDYLKKLFPLSGTKGFLLPVVVALRRDSHPLLSFRSLLTCLQNNKIG
jgi:hypothetical protein